MSTSPADMADMALSLGLVKTREELERAVENAVRRYAVPEFREISAGYEEKPADEDTQREADAFELVLLDRHWSGRAARDSALAMARFRRRKLVDELDEL